MTFDELWGRSTPNSWARVPRGPVAAAVGAFCLVLLVFLPQQLSLV